LHSEWACRVGKAKSMTTILRRLILLCLIAVPSVARASTPVTLGVVTWVGYGPIYCAVANGYFAKRGLDVKLVNFADNAVMPGAVQSGEVDAATLTFDQVVASVSKGWSVKVVLAVDYSAGGDAILAADSIATVKDVKGHKVAPTVHAMVVPGSQEVKAEAESLGLDRIFTEAGFEWRESGCSMCLAMNPDVLQPGERCASTSNRNFEGRQGKGGRTHLVSPAMAAAAAIAGHFVDVREWTNR